MKFKQQQVFILIFVLMVFSLLTAYIAMVSYLIYYADQYRSIGTMSFYLPLLFFSLSSIFLVTQKYSFLGLISSFATYLYYFYVAFYSSESLKVYAIQEYSHVCLLFYIGIALYIILLSILFALIPSALRNPKSNAEININHQ